MVPALSSEAAVDDSSYCDIMDLALFATTSVAYLYLSKRQQQEQQQQQQRVAVSAAETAAATIDAPVVEAAILSTAPSASASASTSKSRSLLVSNGEKDAPAAKNEKQHQQEKEDEKQHQQQQQEKANPSQSLAPVDSPAAAAASLSTTTTPAPAPSPSLVVSNGHENASATKPEKPLQQQQKQGEEKEKDHPQDQQQKQQQKQNLLQSLQDGTSLNANEQIQLVTGDSNTPLPTPGKRSDMRLHNLWHRATYILIKHEPSHIEQHGDHPADVYLLIQRRSMNKDYCPGKLDPTPGGVVGFGESYLENAVRELQEEMGIVIEPDCILDSPPPPPPPTATDSSSQDDTNKNTTTTANDTTHKNRLVRLFTFPYEDEHVRVWGDFYECTYTGALKDLVVQKEEVADVIRMSLEELKDRVQQTPQDFMPDAAHAMLLYFQRRADLQANRRMLKGYSFHNLDAYSLHPKPAAIFFDCDDCLYFDSWKTAKQLTDKIDEWCVKNGLVPGQAYELYKQYGTALRGLLAEGYLADTEEAIDGFLQYVHDIPIAELIKPDELLRQILKQIDPSIPKYIFTASVADHARRCIQALGIEDLFVGIIDCKMCGLESKHSHHSFEVAMKVAGITDPEQCLFFDDNLTNIRAARNAGWRCVLVGRIGRDCGQPVTSEHAELEIDRIHDMAVVLPELFGAGNWRSNVLPMGNDLN